MRSYIDKLTEQEIENLLDLANYELCRDVEDRRTGNPLPAIEKSYDEENNKCNLFIRCKKKESVQNTTLLSLANNKSIKRLLALSMILGKNNYSANGGFLIVSDFEFKEYFMKDLFASETVEEEDNQDKFTDFMKEKFGSDYVKDYNKFAEEYNKRLENEANDEEIDDEEIERS